MQFSIKIIIFIICLLLIISSFFIPHPDSLSNEAVKCIAIFIVAIILWSSQALPLSVTSLLIIALLPLLGVVGPGEAMASFGNKAVFFIIGAFIMATALMKTGLSTRITAYILNFLGNKSTLLPLSILLTAATMSLFMPEHAVVTLMFPIVLEIAVALKLIKGKSIYGKVLFLSLAWGAIIGGVTTYLGGARNPLAIGLLYDHYSLNIGFFQWMLPILPIVVVLLFIAPTILYFSFTKKAEKVNMNLARIELNKLVEKLGKFSNREIRALLIIFLTIIAWVFVGNKIGLSIIAILSASSMFIFQVLEWEDVQKYVNWGIIVMYGGAIVLGKAMISTKAIDFLVTFIESHIHTSKFMMIALISLLSIILTEGISNAAVVAIVLPLAYGIADSMHINPIAITYAVAIPAGLAFSFPIGTPPNAICYSSGYYKLTESLKVGILMNVISWIVFITFAYFYWPLIGLNL